MLNLLTRYRQGAGRVCRVVRVPTVAAEDARQLSRTRDTVTRDRTRVINRLTGLLATHGLRLQVDAAVPTDIEAARGRDGRPVPPGLQARVRCEWAQLQQLHQRRRELTAASRWDRTTPAGPWRQIRNRRELGALASLGRRSTRAGTTNAMGISRAGNTPVRRVMVQLAWSWVAISPTVPSPTGITDGSAGAGSACARLGSSPSLGNGSSRAGGMSTRASGRRARSANSWRRRAPAGA